MSNLIILAIGPFGSIAMLAWVLAAAAPIVIHFWSRRRHRPMKWAAMRYLQAALKKNARRIRVEQLLLLLIRVAILVVFAFAVADPFIPMLGNFVNGLGVDSRTHWVIVVDGSYSMDLRQGDSTRLERAKSAVEDLLADVRQGDGFSLVLMGQPPRVVIGDPAFDFHDAIDELAALPLLPTGADLTATLTEVERIVGDAKRKHKRLEATRVCVISDLQSATWNAVQTPVCSSRIAALSEQSEITLIDIHEPNPQIDNLAVSQVVASESILTVGRSIDFTANIHNFGNQVAEERGVTFFVNDRQVDRKFISVKPGDDAAIVFAHRFESVGDYQVRIQLDRDALALDDQRFFAASVRNSIRALCIDGKQGAAYLVYRSLNPFSTESPYIEAELTPETALLESDLSEFDCVFLCNVGRMSSDEATVLKRYVNAGGGLVIALGDQTQAESYNEQLGVDSDGGRILPASLGELVTAGEHYLVAPADSKHPIAETLRGNPGAGLFTLPTMRYFRLEPVKSSKSETAFVFSSGAPALMEESFGAGRCILFATALSPASVDATTSPPERWSLISDWLNFPALPQEMLASVIRDRGSHNNLLIGDGLAFDVLASSVSDGKASADGVDVPVTVVLSDGTRRAFEVDSMQTGFYQVEIGDNAGKRRQLVAVNLNTSESDLRRYDTDLLPEAITQESLANGDAAPTITTQPTKLFRDLLVAVLLLLLLESFVARRMGAA